MKIHIGESVKTEEEICDLLRHVLVQVQSDYRETHLSCWTNQRTLGRRRMNHKTRTWEEWDADLITGETKSR
jgi:hypothetical protein